MDESQEPVGLRSQALDLIDTHITVQNKNINYNQHVTNSVSRSRLSARTIFQPCYYRLTVRFNALAIASSASRASSRLALPCAAIGGINSTSA